MEAIQLFSFAHTMGLGRVSCYHGQCSGFVGWLVENMGIVGDVLLELIQ